MVPPAGLELTNPPPPAARCHSIASTESVPLSNEYEGSIDSSAQSISIRFKDGIPQDYSLPRAFSSVVMDSLQKEVMAANVRSAFVRELVVHMTSFGIRPPRPFCSLVARRIILKYPFLRDAPPRHWFRKLLDMSVIRCQLLNY